MRVTSKGQVTIPIDIREKAGLLPNTDVEFNYDGNVVTVSRKSGQKAGTRLRMVERLRGTAHTGGLSTDDIMAMTRGE
ncbi:AbrB/MazE/SpoVT family DNA-binding domain-containing protein [Brevundimonas sp. SL130]|uniref:AbrB/MazE/SpoVT family DNA-binding domain-containing protein n=1 Tax=Brevundimonas sp. SL130 TaxID=2995143 RepID=UPI00226C7666|nr:AbrB/MazE/SpoVT family DNA-binding domain-containing protein [Brevundimonas sp. SL130]WAC61042.1 AbrB/MazE/SpoVT family DNA-binding domain-containing protein [Brevundimonas sp. SL130]